MNQNNITPEKLIVNIASDCRTEMAMLRARGHKSKSELLRRAASRFSAGGIEIEDSRKLAYEIYERITPKEIEIARHIQDNLINGKQTV